MRKKSDSLREAAAAMYVAKPADSGGRAVGSMIQTA